MHACSSLQLTSLLQQVIHLASHLTFGYFAVFVMYNKVRIKEFPDTIDLDIYPVILLVYVVIMLCTAIRQTPCLCANVGRVLRAPFSQVTFFQTFIGDWMTSLVKPAQDLLYTIMFLVTGRAFGTCDTKYWQHCSVYGKGDQAMQPHCTVLLVMLPFLSAFPLLVRMMQCLRKYRDTGDRWPNLANAWKYAFATVVVWFGTFSPNLYDMEDIEPSQYIFITVCVISTLYTYSWDVYQDWSLRPHKCEHGGLRAKRMYQHRVGYYVAICLDLFLRYLWVLSLVPHKDKSPFGRVFTDYFSPFFGILEICRRTMWGFFRVENEHLGNFEGYKKIKYVPLQFDDIAGGQNLGIRESPRRKWIGVLEISLFIIGVIAFGIIAYLDRVD